MENIKINGQFIEEKKILFILPHQDDEINMCGGVIFLLSRKNDIHILYTTNGDYIFPAAIRYQEAFNSLRHLGISKENVFFLGYPDQPYDQDSHIYMSDGSWLSKKGKNITYSPNSKGEWCFCKKGVHHRYNKKNLKNDIKDFIEETLYDMIFCIDLDFHPDHIATSLSFEKAMGELIKERNYHPIVLKGFAYENSFYGKKDFFNINPVGMKFEKKKKILRSNPYYETAVQFSVPKECYSRNLLKNPVFKAISAHKSQVFCAHAESAINSNNVFFERCTENLALSAKISVTSGNAEYLNDFLLCDASNIMHGNKKRILYNRGIWIPDAYDEKKEIVIQLPQKSHVEYMKFYHGLLNEHRIKKVSIEIEGTSEINMLEDGYVSTVWIGKETSGIIIKILDTHIVNGFSEIEIIEKKTEKIKIIKGVLNDTWTALYRITTEQELKLEIYSSFNKDKFDISIRGEGVILEDRRILRTYPKVNAKLQIIDKENGLEDTICIKSIHKVPRYLCSKLSVSICSCYQRVVRKILSWRFL